MAQNPSALYRALPPMNAVLETLTAFGTRPDGKGGALAAAIPRPFLRELIESFLDGLRADVAKGIITDAAELALPALLPRLIEHVRTGARPHLRRVINATGVVIHTNLGRSVLPEEAVAAVAEAARHYSNLEFDLDGHSRGSRYSHVEPLIRKLTGAEAALVVNNNAAAVMLVLDTLCKGREVVVSRGELVEIGGSFRIPEVMEKSGCILKEVGATNRTHPRDYTGAVTEQTAAFLKVHRSNFRITGFASEVDRAELAALAHERGLPCIEDLGSGTLFDFAAANLPHLATEITAARVLDAGVDIVTFSGDKVLGGPQAGIIAGRAEYVGRIKKNPLNRALRIDKLTLAALEATLNLYRDPALALRRVPTLRMIAMSADELLPRARRLARLLAKALAGRGGGYGVTLRRGMSRTGGGAFPEQDLPTWLAAVASSLHSPDALREALLVSDPPLVGRVEDGALCLDPRTLDDAEFPLAVQAVAQAADRLGA